MEETKMHKRVMGLLVFIFLLVASQAFAKDVYVRAGAKGGMGTIAKPYGTIEEAMAMGVYSQDVIHVAQGIYYGEGGSGKWLISTPQLSLIGGYKADFSLRDPFVYQSILIRGMGEDALTEAKKRDHATKWGLNLTPTKASYNGGAMISQSGEAKNTIIDGFVIDGYTRNTYKSNGDLNTSVGPIGNGGPLISFNQPGSKVLNCVVMNSGGPGIQMNACGVKDDPESWPEISNCIILNTLMEAIDFRVGTMDAKTNPDGGYAVIKNNTLAFVWSYMGEGYGILIGRQTRLTIENNIIAFATDFGMNNGFGNDKAKLVGNVFFNCMGGVYRYFSPEGSKTTLVVDDPELLSGKPASKMYYLSDKSGGNMMADPAFSPDPAFFDKFTNQIKSTGGGKVVWDEVNQWRSALGLPLIGSTGTGATNFAPIYEHDFMFLTTDAFDAGAKKTGGFAVYKSKAIEMEDKDYVDIKLANIKSNFGKDVSVAAKIGNKDTSSYYVEGVTTAGWVCFRLADDSMNFVYVQKGSEALEVITDAIKDGVAVILKGKVVDISAAIKSTNRYAIVVDIAESDE